MLRVPDEEVFFLFDILRTIPHEAVDPVVAENRRLYETNRDLGGEFYTISAVPMGHHDWVKHFQPFWGLLNSQKSKHDPDNVLGPGPGVFA